MREDRSWLHPGMKYYFLSQTLLFSCVEIFVTSTVGALFASDCSVWRIEQGGPALETTLRNKAVILETFYK